MVELEVDGAEDEALTERVKDLECEGLPLSLAGHRLTTPAAGVLAGSLWWLRVFLQEISSSSEITRKKEFPLLREHSVSCIRQLMPFFTTLNCAFKAQSQLPADMPGTTTPEFPVSENPRVLRQLEECVEQDFLEHPEC